MASCHHWPVEDDDPLDEEGALAFWRLPRAFSGKRHTEKIEAFKTVAQTWRMRERVSLMCCAQLLFGFIPQVFLYTRVRVACACGYSFA